MADEPADCSGDAADLVSDRPRDFVRQISLVDRMDLTARCCQRDRTGPAAHYPERLAPGESVGLTRGAEPSRPRYLQGSHLLPRRDDIGARASTERARQAPEASRSGRPDDAAIRGAVTGS